MYRNIGKRAFDLLVVVGAFLMLWPFMAFVAILIKIFDPGPIFFKQLRTGKGGENFWFYKFRSMPVNTGDIASDKLGEVKLTWIGKFIRRTNIDELPQLLNIFFGDMSVVGPRPPIPSQVELIELRRQNGALNLRPGLTGLAQVNSFNGMRAADKAAFDEQYANNVTLINDIKIILKTFLYLMKPPPVY
jgi:O-antigen biosynthesis protein WbqP